jgi:hypothetical protein
MFVFEIPHGRGTIYYFTTDKYNRQNYTGDWLNGTRHTFPPIPVQYLLAFDQSNSDRVKYQPIKIQSGREL